MADPFTAVVAAPEADAVAAGVLAGRAAEGKAEVLIFDSQGLVDFFAPDLQRRLPRSYRLVLSGQEVVHTDWDGRLVRPGLMDALRAFLGPIRWFSSAPWEPEDRRAVGHIVGEENLALSGGRSLAAAVLKACCEPHDEYAALLVRLTERRGAGAEEERQAEELHLVLSALKGERGRLAEAAGALMEGGLQDVLEAYAERARRIADDNRRFAREHAGEPLPMGEMKLVTITLPAPRQPFWVEVSRYARQEAEAELSLCCLGGRSVMLLEAESSVRADLRTWARYVTDLLPPAQTVGARPQVVPIVVRGLADDPGLVNEALRLMTEGAHLLKG